MQRCVYYDIRDNEHEEFATQQKLCQFYKFDRYCVKCKIKINIKIVYLLHVWIIVVISRKGGGSTFISLQLS